jgi:hypothetical protein
MGQKHHPVSTKSIFSNQCMYVSKTQDFFKVIKANLNHISLNLGLTSDSRSLYIRLEI